MKRYVCFFACLILFVSFSFAQKIIVMNPVAGKPFIHGDLLKVRWRATGVTGKVQVFLVSRSDQYLIKKTPVTKGLAQYRITTMVRPGQYAVVVKGRGATGRSAKFPIRRAQRTRLNQPRSVTSTIKPVQLPDLTIVRLEIIEQWVDEDERPLNKAWVNPQGSPDFHVNASLTFKLTIRNNGVGRCNRRFVAQVMETDDFRKVTKAYSGGLSPGQNVLVTLGPTGIFTETARNPLKLGIHVDVGNLVRESDETNNGTGATCAVGTEGH